MNMVDPVAGPVRGMVDGDGRLIEADQPLLDLNARAGGAVGAPIAIPQVFTLARLSQRLGILVSRGVVAADGDDDLELWVRAEPAGGNVRLTLSGWQRQPPWAPRAPAEQRGDDFLRSAGDWRWETDAALRLTFLSISAGATFGFDAAALLGQPLTRLFALGDDGEGGFPIISALAQRVAFDDQRATIRDSGQAVCLAASPRSDDSGAFAGFVGAARAIEPSAPAAPVVEEPPIGEFALRLDSALRLPLGRIIANADSINAHSEGPIDELYADYAADIASAGRHLLGLVDDLVNLQAIERPGFAVAHEPLDLADVARRAAGLLNVRAAEAKVRIAAPAPEAAVPAVGEFRRALQVLVNLIGNAVRYSPASGTVRVTVQRVNGAAIVHVADEGKGIALADQTRIFEKFARIDPSEPGGSGLGLYIARRLARAMGGDITVESAAGEGARFSFALPARD